MRVIRIEIFPQDRRRVSGGGSLFYPCPEDEIGRKGAREHAFISFSPSPFSDSSRVRQAGRVRMTRKAVDCFFILSLARLTKVDSPAEGRFPR